MDYYSLLRPLLFALEPETAHGLAVAALRSGLLPAQPQYDPEILRTECFGLSFANPIGLAAGFDKNAAAVGGLSRQGFGFLELGTVTPQPQPGNPRPRMFRLSEDEAVINRLGFNNAGLEAFCRNLSALPQTGQGPARSGGGLGGQAPQSTIKGLNIGKNKTSTDAVADYVTGLQKLYAHADYITVNISSPNTEGLRDLQQKQQLDELLAALSQTRGELRQLYNRTVPLLLKIAPDLTPQAQEDIVGLALVHGIDGLIVGNTTVARPESLHSRHASETGGLSGRPLMQPSTAILRNIYRLGQGRIPLIGVGGIACGADAYAKIRAGGSLVQLYSALVYQGFGLVTRIRRELAQLLEKDGFARISDAVGVDVN